MAKIILQKYLAQIGYCSRKQAEKFLRAGKIKVNGKTVQGGILVDENDEIRVGSKPVKHQKQKKVYLLLNKPRGYTCTNRQFRGEKNVLSLVEPYLKRWGLEGTKLHIAGRLDKNSRGLVLLTNDGDLTIRLTHPRFSHQKEYLIEIEAELSRQEGKKIAQKLEEGIKGGNERLAATGAQYLGGRKFRIILTEGKKRQLRRMFSVLGHKIVDLQRVRLAQFKLEKNLAEGKIMRVDPLSNK